MTETVPPELARIATGTPARPAENVNPGTERRSNIPVIPNLGPREDLLIWQHKQELADAIKNNSTIILAAGTGSGKTRGGTEIALEALGPEGKMIVTENLKRATEKSAEVVAADLKVELGKEVGIRNRDTHEFSNDTKLLFCPVQSLLVIMEDDPLLERYSLIAMDEVHKESKANELAMIRLRDIQAQRKAAGKPELKLMFVSATADKEKITRHFPDAVTVDVPGKTYDVDESYETRDIPVADLPKRAAEKVKSAIAAGDKGNILVFLSGQKQIEEATNALGSIPDADVIPYSSTASQEEQDALFKSSPRRKIVLATNAAQEGLTLDINIVVDTGMHKHSELDIASGRQLLYEQKAPQDHLTQRRGRVGRKESPYPGQHDKYYALFTQSDRAGRPVHEAAEMQRTDISQEMLLLLAQGNTDVYNFHYINPPPRSHIDVALARLTKTGAVKDGRLTEKGKLMAELQLEDPSNASMIVSATKYGAVKQASALAAMLESYENALDPENPAIAAFRHPDSDALGYIKIFQTFRDMPDEARQKRWAKDNGLNYWKLHEADRVYSELLHTLKNKQPGLQLEGEETRRALDQSIAEGFADGIIKTDRNGEYFLEKVGKVQVDKDSVLNGKRQPLFVTLNLQPFMKDETITARKAKLNHVISEDTARETLAAEPAPAKPAAAAPAETATAPPAKPQEEKKTEEPSELPPPPPKPPTVGQRIKNWFSHSIFGKVWRWFIS